MTDTNIVNIHGKAYMTVAGRVQLAHENVEYISITTELVKDEPVTIKATVVLKRKGRDHEETYSDYSAANPTKLIEKQSPIEVASTSAIGRALGFAGFGSVESIASADEMVKAGADKQEPIVVNNLEEALKHKGKPVSINPHVEKALGKICPDCGEGTIVLNPKTQKLFCDKKCWLNPKKVEEPEEVMDEERIDPEDIPF